MQAPASAAPPNHRRTERPRLRLLRGLAPRQGAVAPRGYASDAEITPQNLRGSALWLCALLRALNGLKDDLEPMPGRLGEAPERTRRGQAAPAFQPRDGALRRLHAL